jgi:hypothetical protein
MYFDSDFALHRQNAIQGSARLRDAILRSLGYPVIREPHKRKFKAPKFGLVPKCKTGRPAGCVKKDFKTKEIQEVKVIVGRYHRVTVKQLNAGSKKPMVCHARQVAMFAAKHIVKASYPDIAKSFAGRHHTTVMHAVAVVQKRLDAGDQDTIRAVKAVQRKLAA